MEHEWCPFFVCTENSGKQQEKKSRYLLCVCTGRRCSSSSTNKSIQRCQNFPQRRMMRRHRITEASVGIQPSIPAIFLHFSELRLGVEQRGPDVPSPLPGRSHHDGYNAVDWNIKKGNERQWLECALAALPSIKKPTVGDAHTLSRQTMLSHTSSEGDCCVLATSCLTAGVLLADTGLIDALLPGAIKGLIGEKIGPIERECVEEIDGNKHIFILLSSWGRVCVCVRANMQAC